ncbi:hypothetical protein B0T17DRAFT_528860 [Bombardia bombarda]|uniref:Uncharacterized protein n=1 Tax=Bombardia bombarda TaxID=252184 RepID=A0AA40C9Z8_9PEZI|nr:hypothetical protein B0T17DRAFT_528860 [Bombardia bombarda]
MMSCRCSPSPRAFLPFLYPSFSHSNGLAAAVAVGVAAKRRSSTNHAKSATRLNPTPDDYSMSSFADKAKLTVYAGAGGHGCIAFLKEAYVEEGPANGGDGGHGGNVYIQAVHGETSLHKLSRKSFVRAGRGKHGQGSSRGGPRGDDVVITVPVGTILTELSRQDPEADEAFYQKTRRQQKKAPMTQNARDREREERQAEAEAEANEEEDEADDKDREKWLLYPGVSSSEARRITLPPLPIRERLFTQPRGPLHLDLSRPTPRPILLAAGGIGGLGNPHFVSKERPRPMFATKGEDAMSMQIELELKLLADVGLVGLPNAGKSTLLRSLSNSRARVGSWAFTTLQPNIGTVVLDNNKGRPKVTSFRRQATAANPIDPYGEDDEPETELKLRTSFTIADIPGLIEGAHLDKGLGIEFLRHVERAGVLAFVIDLAAGNAVEALKALWNEVGLYAQMREDEERDRERAARIDWRAEAGTEQEEEALHTDEWWPPTKAMADYIPTPDPTGLHIAAKPWFVVATKGDLPDTQENFKELRSYLDSITDGIEPHPSGVKGAWTDNCTAIPVSAINGHGVDRVVHWTVGLLDG